jgi:ketosteroid isomerase-like protein
MNRRIFFFAVLLALAAPSFAPAQSPGAMDVVNKVIAASEAIDAEALRGLYTDNAVFIDEGPIVIYGPTVGVDWATRVKKAFADRHMTEFKATASAPAVAQIKPDGAYVVVPMELNARVGADKHFHESGTFTFTLVNQSGNWKISSQVWTVLNESVK